MAPRDRNRGLALEINKNTKVSLPTNSVPFPLPKGRLSITPST